MKLGKLHHLHTVPLAALDDLAVTRDAYTNGHTKSTHKPYNTKEKLYKDNQARLKREKAERKRAGVPARITARASRARSGNKR